MLTLMECRYRHVHLQRMEMKGIMLETVAVKTEKVKRLAADKGYDADVLRNFLKKKGIQPQIRSCIGMTSSVWYFFIYDLNSELKKNKCLSEYY